MKIHIVILLLLVTNIYSCNKHDEELAEINNTVIEKIKSNFTNAKVRGRVGFFESPPPSVHTHFEGINVDSYSLDVIMLAYKRKPETDISSNINGLYIPLDYLTTCFEYGNTRAYDKTYDIRCYHEDYRYKFVVRHVGPNENGSPESLIKLTNHVVDSSIDEVIQKE